MGRLRYLPPRLTPRPSRLQPVEIRTARRVKTTDPFYGSSEWKALRSAVVQERGRQCQDCGSVTGRVYVDHVRELKDGGAPLDRSNLRIRCASCHVEKTARTRAERMRS